MTLDRVRAGLWATAFVVAFVAAFRVTLAEPPAAFAPGAAPGQQIYSGTGMR